MTGVRTAISAAVAARSAGPTPLWRNGRTTRPATPPSRTISCAGNQCFRGDDHSSGRAGATATIRFSGTQEALLSVRDWGNGIAAMSIDGGSEERLDHSSGIRVGEELNYLSPVPPPGPHTLRVRVTGSRNPDSGSTVISLYRIEVYGE